MSSIREAILLLSSQLTAKENPRKEAEDILAVILKCSRSSLHSLGLTALADNDWKTACSYARRRMAGEPLAYIQSCIEFYHCLFKLNPSVLIPRQETEVLVDKIVQQLKKQDLEQKVLLDLCCGSGCIGIALKKQFPFLKVILSDISAEAIALARQNAEENNVEVLILEGDLLDPLKGQKVNFCVCNPPYISENEFAKLDFEVKAFEPRIALVGGPDGLEFYRRLSRDLPACLYPHAQVWLEIGYLQGKDVENVFQSGCWKNHRLENDWAGHNRFFFLENE
ncbi:MAG: peptide chain release factor N(5)-glutamine methyltransferase [Candidatus Protochlamydia sp.]|nr:peptide chain release factor N(5)-glutamine methyltransferase [Candidatus Protochlamydia sp.]